jgi:hypothetical protein
MSNRWGKADSQHRKPEHRILTYSVTTSIIHNWIMRTTINLDDDVHLFASTYAHAKGISLSEAIGELVRKAEVAPAPGADSPRREKNPHGYLVIAGTGDPLTSEMVKEASEDKLV